MPDLPPRRRSAQPSWMQPITARLTPTIKALVLANTLLYAIYVFIETTRPLIRDHLALGPGFLRGEVWQPLTSLFVHLNPLGFALDLLCIWSIGAALERTQGTRRFLILFLGGGILANLGFAAVSALSAYHAGDITDGCAFAVLALFVGYGRIYGRTPTPVLGGLVLQARTFAMVFVAFFAVMSLSRGDWASLAGTAVTTVAGYLLAAPGGISQLWAGIKARRLRRRYRVLEGGARRPPKKYLN
jgi:membrane associated rhomboid family serine protease